MTPSITRGLGLRDRLRQEFFEQDRPADQRVAAMTDPGLDRKVEVAGTWTRWLTWPAACVTSTSSACGDG
jgi:hypothetical protein